MIKIIEAYSGRNEVTGGYGRLFDSADIFNIKTSLSPPKTIKQITRRAAEMLTID